MSDTKELLQKIAALRTRLEPAGGGTATLPGPAPDPAAPADAVRRVEEKVQRGSRYDALLDRSLRPLDPAADLPTLPARLTARGARLLRKGRELLHALRLLTDDPNLRMDNDDPLAGLHHESAALIDVLLRTVQAFPEAPSAQLRLCEGLEIVLATAEERVRVLCATLRQREAEGDRISILREILVGLAVGGPVGLTGLQGLADAVIDDARAGLPLRFLYAAPADPARFAAAHGLTTAQVLARLLLDDAEWRPQLQTAVMAALVHDVGMTRVPAELLTKAGPLTDEERRLVERHAAVGGPMVDQLWPGGGWPVEAVTDHHERSDGTGYPLGKKEMATAGFVRLLAVCDVYAALAAPRPHRPAADTRTALTDTLLMAEHNLLDRFQAERLLVLSFYPAGSVVQLDDGAMAVVVGAQPGPRGLAHPTRPVVQLLTDGRGQPLPLPRVIDLVERTDRSILRHLTRAERRQALAQTYPALV